MCNLCGKTGHKKDECWFKDSRGYKGKDTRGKSKGKDGKTLQQQQQFQGKCSHCGKWGHKKADCRSVGALGGASSNASVAASTVGPSASQAGASIGAVAAEPYWVMGLTATEKN